MKFDSLSKVEYFQLLLYCGIDWIIPIKFVRLFLNTASVINLELYSRKPEPRPNLFSSVMTTRLNQTGPIDTLRDRAM